jgi:hypothetical protein
VKEQSSSFDDLAALELGSEGSFALVLSEPIIDEVLKALAYPKGQKAARSKTDPALWFEDLVVLSQLIGDDFEVRPTCRVTVARLSRNE